jgi:alpha-1,6-mannosyltransferase
MFDYIMHGRILGVYGGNPFVQVGASFPQDPFLPYTAWRDTPSAYGPLWVLPTGAIAALAGNGVVANVLAFKLLGGVFLAASVAVVGAILRRVAPDRALAGVLLLAWNPLVLYETLGHGHNDIAMAFWILAAVWALVSRRYTLSILALVAGALTKFVPVLLIPAAGLIALRDLPDRRARWRFLVLAGVSAILLAGLAYAPFWHGVETLGVGRRGGLYTASLPAFAFVLLSRPLGEGVAAWAVSTTAAGLTALFALWQAVRARQDRSWWSFPQAAFNILMFYLLLTCLWFQQWYAVWPLGLAALLPAGRGAFLGVLFSFTVLAKPLVFEPMWLWLRPFPTRLWRELRLGPAVMALPWLLALYHICRSRLPRARGPSSGGLLNSPKAPSSR